MSSAHYSGDDLGGPDLIGLFRAAVGDASPEERVNEFCSGMPGNRWTVLAVGKAAASMARGAARGLGTRLVGGLAVAPSSEACPVERWSAAHPVPDDSSLRAGAELLRRARGADGPVLFLISGGGSSLVSVPAPGLALEDKIAVIRMLTTAGADIGAVNVVRRSLSAIKGGRLAAALPSGLEARSLIVSDVVGDALHDIASGPTVACPDGPHDARAVLEQYGAWERASESVRRRAGAAIEWPAVTAPAELIAGIDTVARCAEARARRAGLGVRREPTALAGPVDDLAERLDEIARQLAPGQLWVGHGEASIRLGPSLGIGGRASHLALLLAGRWKGGPYRALIAGTDGRDGNSAAAGAVVDGTSWARMGDPTGALASLDSHTALAEIGAAVHTGPTGVNHADLFLLWRS